MGNQTSNIKSPTTTNSQAKKETNNTQSQSPSPSSSSPPLPNIQTTPSVTIQKKIKISDSPVTGSPLFSADKFSQGALSFFLTKIPLQIPFLSDEEKKGKEPMLTAPTDQERKLYQNSSKITHDFGKGISGLAPLSSIKGTEKKKDVIPIMLSWTGGGEHVHITGTFNNWKQKIRMTKSTADFTTIIDLPPGTHRFKFIVDNEWKCSEDLPISSDTDGNLVNFIQVSDERGDQLDDGFSDLSESATVSKTLESQISKLKLTPEAPLSQSPPESYSNKIPVYLLSDPENDQGKRKKHDDLMFKSDEDQEPVVSIETPPTEPPPLLPRHCEKVLLNSAAESKSDPSLLPVPNHVNLNHLYACSIRDGVMALACTSRYKKKYVTTVLYKPITF